MLFASATASDGVRKVIATSTGPKISTCAIVLDGATHARKLRAVQAFRSQLDPDATTGQAPVLPEHVLARLTRPFEVVLI